MIFTVTILVSWFEFREKFHGQNSLSRALLEGFSEIYTGTFFSHEHILLFFHGFDFVFFSREKEK